MMVPTSLVHSSTEASARATVSLLVATRRKTYSWMTQPFLSLSNMSNAARMRIFRAASSSFGPRCFPAPSPALLAMLCQARVVVLK